MKNKYFFGSLVIGSLLLSCFLIVSFFTLGYFTGRGSGNVISEVHELEDFEEIVYKGQGNVIFTQSEEFEVVIVAEDNIIERMNIEVEDKRLIVDYGRKYFWPFGSMIFPTKDINVYIKSPNITNVRLDGTSNFNSDYIDTKELHISLNGAIKLDILELHTDNLVLNVDGVSECQLKGKTTNQSIQINGAGKYYANELISENTVIEINGSSDVSVHATKSLEIEINGTGEVTYSGDPEKLDKKINGVGEIKKYEN